MVTIWFIFSNGESYKSSNMTIDVNPCTKNIYDSDAKDVVKPLLLEQGSTKLVRSVPVRTVNN